MNRSLMAAALGLAAACAQAQTAPADPARADAAVPPTRYTSPLAPFRAATEPARAPSATWVDSNAVVAGAKGHDMHREMPAEQSGHEGRHGHEAMHDKKNDRPGTQEHHQ